MFNIVQKAGISIKELMRKESNKHVFLLHGYGANADNLASLLYYLDAKQEYNWYFPEGILELDMVNPDNTSARAWFPVDFDVLNQMQPQLRNYTSYCPNGFLEAADKLNVMLQEYNFSPEQVVLGGFSQGAIMSTELMLRSEKNYRGVLIFSGTCVYSDRWQNFIDQKEASFSTSIFQSHGEQDPLLPMEVAKTLNQMLQKISPDITFRPFPGTHEIPLPIVEEAKEFLEKVFIS